jgi:hypothetical protein
MRTRSRAWFARAERGGTDPPKRRRVWRVPLVAAGLLIVPVLIEVMRSDPAGRYPSEGEQLAAPVDERDLNLIRQAVVRYQLAHLVPNDLAPSAASRLTGVCVGFGPAGAIDPSAAQLEAVKEPRLTIAPYTACVKDGMKGRAPIWVVSVSATGADSVQAVGRSAQNSYVYSLERRQGVWVVTAAKLTGRTMARAL